ncbi:DNA replication factor Dna2-domain-containing protein [Sphaerosporella brunnea]|uniref:DNA replication ATP-dependent helicase/nuclease DNA2 n=1 Tax=Sphaerosporella brunnea TaxID=1250544 RepID=A0A5J5ECA7_9PEZI|nr:DNA replication factor Dna2-domain-containing protein [Sphaerosporella brunnea]
MVYGNVLHALLQAALEQHDFSTQNLRFHTDRILIDNIESLYFLREELNTAGAYVESKVPLLQEWANIFISSKPNAKATVKDHRGKESPIIAINKLLDIEERIWSPLYGLKGNIDATVQAIVIEPKAGRSSSGSSEKTLTVPLELKTGRSEAMEHRAQTMLYTLLMSDRYDINVSGGLLYYLETNEMIRVPAIRNELRELIIKRNHVASFILSRESLPHMLQDPHACSRCYAKISCFVCHKLLEDGDANSSGVHETFQDETSHLNEKHKAFFKHWDTLLSKEEKDTVKLRRELWSMTSPEREAAGRCFGKLVIVPEFIAVDQSNPKINRYTYSFRKAAPPADFSFLESQINEGDPVVVSDEKGHIALAIGYVFQISKTEITLQVDRRLHNARRRQKDFDEESHQVFDGIELPATYQCEPHSSPHVTETILFRIDRDEFSNGMAKIRNNLIQLMSKEAGKHRRLIVDLETPEFKEHPAAYQLDCVSTLNEDQKRAINTVMSARDYALVLGMPGTGKTTTLSHIIRALVSQGKSVLLTSYTHTAVDNILLKMKDEKFGVLRLGNRSKVPLTPRKSIRPYRC